MHMRWTEMLRKSVRERVTTSVDGLLCIRALCDEFGLWGNVTSRGHIK